MVLTPATYNEMVSLSRSIPVFGLMHSEMCGHCITVLPKWDRFVKRYENDTSVLLVDCDCTTHPQTCHAATRIPGYPTFMLIYAGQTMNVRVNRKLKGFVRFIEDVKALDPTIPCRRFLNQTDGHPLLVLSGSDEQATCDTIMRLSGRIPRSDGRILLGPSRGAPGIFVQLRTNHVINYTGGGDLESFAIDFLHEQIGEWPLAEAATITWRRFAYLIGANEWHKRIGRNFAVADVAEKWCIGFMKVALFRRLYPEVDIGNGELPGIAVFSRDRARFKLMKDLSWGDDLEQLLVNMANQEDNSEMMLPWRDVESLPPEEEVAEAFADMAHQTDDTAHQIDETDPPDDAEDKEALLNHEEQNPDREGDGDVRRPVIEQYEGRQDERKLAEEKKTSTEEPWPKAVEEVEERSEEDELYYREREEM
jgi:hypothetical protein